MTLRGSETRQSMLVEACALPINSVNLGNNLKTAITKHFSRVSYSKQDAKTNEFFLKSREVLLPFFSSRAFVMARRISFDLQRKLLAPGNFSFDE